MSLGKQKAFKGMGMEGWVAHWYARTRGHDIQDFRRRAKEVAERLPQGSDLLEVAPGPGYFAIELSKLGCFRITGLDVSRTMVEIANQNAVDADAKIDFRQGDAAAMPFEDDKFDFVYCAAAFKNFTDPVKALNEMHRVLRVRGKATIMDLRRDVSKDEIASMVRQSGRTMIDGWITRQIFRHVLIKRAYSEDDFIRMVKDSRFVSSDVVKDLFALEIRMTKTGV
jgi:ubiquinone/menaquinone biosynthesis C-methylase UbiE